MKIANFIQILMKLYLTDGDRLVKVLVGGQQERSRSKDDGGAAKVHRDGQSRSGSDWRGGGISGEAQVHHRAVVREGATRTQRCTERLTSTNQESTRRERRCGR